LEFSLAIRENLVQALNSNSNPPDSGCRFGSACD